ncbi:helix-turn-helix domain-containing protein [Actinomadura sp. 7K507]|uniref:PucR family transcriptional regulator n=1 Tax=Actinomadura sp. 7K507 TaxID=2530365 RepID=UPI0010474A93|nr:helix-turn-helix domain-containing protein [Actinomadura sp. 7K507]TDC91030.1 PucR family transcriptional regulator [Actinomadura sp. 7K507]
MNEDDTDWTPVIDLIERVNGDEDLLASVVAGVSSLVREVSVLPPADIAGHTRVLLAAATRAIASRRGPTEAELSFVAELGVTRARQGVPIEAVLSAIHVAERAIWSRAREVAAREGIRAGLLLDARELYDDWAEAVRSRLIKAHREAQAGGRAGPDERDAAILRRLLDGGSAAALAAAEAGLPPNTPLWVLTTRPAGAHEPPRRLTATTRDVPGSRGPGVSALLDGLLVAVAVRAPAADGAAYAVGIAGPAEPENLAAARRLAVSALAAAEATGRTGPVHAADVAVLAAITDRTDLASVLLERHRAAWTGLGASGEPVARAVCAWLEAGRDVTSAAGRLFVHPNTVRNRVQRFTEATGIDPSDTFGAVNAWWLCRTWLAPA